MDATNKNILIGVGILFVLYTFYYLDIQIDASKVCQVNGMQIKTFFYLFILLVFVLFLLHWLKTKNSTWIEGLQALSAREVYTNGMFGTTQSSPELPDPWDPEVVKKFVQFQSVHNANVIFDMIIIQQQATQKEAEDFLKKGEWTWSKETEDLYLEKVSRSKYVKGLGHRTLPKLKSVYNEKAILQFIAMSDEPESDLLIKGVYVPNEPDTRPEPESGFGTFGVNSGLEPDKSKDLIRCSVSSENTNSTPTMIRLPNDPKKKKSLVDFHQLPELIKGFTFHKEPCNPCVALKFPPDYSCAFSLKKDENSPAWESVWGTTPSSIGVSERQKDIKRIHDNDYVHAVSGWLGN